MNGFHMFLMVAVAVFLIVAAAMALYMLAFMGVIVVHAIFY